MLRRAITILAFVVAIVLTVVGSHYCNHKIIPLIRLALWFPLPYLLNVNGGPGVLLAWVQFPLLAFAFSLAIRRWPVRWVLAAIVIGYLAYAAVIIALIGPIR
jgi:hypothetical protein